jgi:NADH dehydrogenase (ubiquinone) 1 alpha subcomplex subunit 9
MLSVIFLIDCLFAFLCIRACCVLLLSVITPAVLINRTSLFCFVQQHTTDVVLPGVPTLLDLGMTPTKMEDQVPWELKPWRAGAYYDEELGEFEKPQPPKEVFV